MGTHPIFESDFDCLTGFEKRSNLREMADGLKDVVNNLKHVVEEVTEEVSEAVAGASSEINAVSSEVNSLVTAVESAGNEFASAVGAVDAEISKKFISDRNFGSQNRHKSHSYRSGYYCRRRSAEK